MRLVNSSALFLGLWLAAAPAPAANTTVRLLLSHESARPGETIWAGLEMRMAPRWHTYWLNGGESGDATRIQWTLPAGMIASDILWPVPEKYVSGGLTTFVYHDVAILLIPISIAADAPAGTFELKAKASWLECEEQCVPGKGDVVAKLTVGSESRPSTNAPSLETARKKLPQPRPDSFARAWWEKEASGDIRPVFIEWTPGTETKQGDFFPLAPTNSTVKPGAEKGTSDGARFRVRKEVEKGEGWPGEISGLLIEQDAAGGLLAAYQVKLPIQNSAAVNSPANGKSTGESAPASGIEKKSLVAWLGLAFLGGLILNLMPCVLPVIALKIFGFVAQSHEAPGRVRQLGLVYGLGVLFSFLILAGIVIAVQGAGKLASWGMQFGNPYFVVGMTVLIALVAFNFFGLFEVTLAGGATGAAAELASREGASGAFFNGVLATALATPCTAPFLAPALGFAFAQPAGIIVLMFGAVAVGLAAPYVLLSFQPAWLKFLPKPGAWMEKFKIAMGFPMLATALWLLSIVGRHYGTSGMMWVGMFLVFVGIAAWIWGEFVQRGSKRKSLAMALSLLFLGGGYLFALEGQLNWRTPRSKSGANSPENSYHNQPGGIPWQSWSREAVEKARKEGRPVFVDFTADWCVTCQANKKTSIEIASVRDKLEAINAVPLLGDYTLVPDDITAELKRYGRAGVPLVLVYPKDPAKDAVVLPALLTPSIVLDTLDQAAR